MRIVHYISDFGLGGIEKGGCVLAAAMAAQGHEAWVVGGAGGPRYRENAGPRLTHVIRGGTHSQAVLPTVREVRADVVHIHRSGYVEGLIRDLAAEPKEHRPLVVSTPVFGRTPNSAELLEITRVCLVGTYTFYRFCKWLGLPPGRVATNGVGYVPITPYEPPATPLSTLDPIATIQQRRAEFGIDPQMFVVGRLGRDSIAKWSYDNEDLVDALLKSDPLIQWLSIGFPQAMGRDRLRERWGNRFLNLPETPDYQRIANVLSSLDVQMFFGQGECFASSIAEAAGVGVPTIGLATPLRDNGQAEQVIDDFNGYLVGSIDQAIRFTNELMKQPEKLRSMKSAAREHCLARWSADRAAKDLLSLYAFWRNPSQRPDYVDLMLRETEQFGSGYRSRIAKLMGTSALSRAKWRILLAAVESGPVFKLGRAVRRLRHWKVYRDLPTE